MRVILVDDEPDALKELMDFFSRVPDFEVIETYSLPSKVLTEISKTNPDCAFIDIKMPGMSGIELSERIQKLNPDIKTVFVTASNNYATQAFEVNAVDYLLKPVRLERFMMTLDKLRKVEKNTPDIAKKEVYIKSLGRFEVLMNNVPLAWNRTKSRELLAYLLHYEGQQCHRLKICDDIWPTFEQKQALINLRTTVYALRKNIGDLGREFIRVEFIDESYRLICGKLAWDKKMFEGAYNAYMKAGLLEMGESAMKIYRNDYLGQEDWPWSRDIQDNLQTKYLQLTAKIVVQYFHLKEYEMTLALIKKLYTQHSVSQKMKIILLEASYQLGGTLQMKEEFRRISNFYKNEYDEELEEEVLKYYKGKIQY